MDYMLFSLGSNDPLAERIAKHLNQPLGNITLRTFADGEQYIQFGENIRGRDVFLIQSTNPPAENLMRLFLALDAARGASANRVNVVIPYYGYARQDRKSKPREPIAARTIAALLESLGVHQILTMDLHNDAIGGFFRETNVDYLYARPVMVAYMKDFFKDEIKKDELVVVSPDAGGVVRAQSYAKRLMKDAEMAIIHKERDLPNQVARMKIVGDVADKTALIVDDMFDTCGTLTRAVDLLVESGAREVYATAPHGIFSNDAIKKIEASPIKKLFIADTIANEKDLSDKIETISVGDLFADAIHRTSQGESLSALFEDPHPPH